MQTCVCAPIPGAHHTHAHALHRDVTGAPHRPPCRAPLASPERSWSPASPRVGTQSLPLRLTGVEVEPIKFLRELISSRYWDRQDTTLPGSDTKEMSRLCQLQPWQAGSRPEGGISASLNDPMALWRGG